MRSKVLFLALVLTLLAAATSSAASTRARLDGAVAHTAAGWSSAVDPLPVNLALGKSVSASGEYPGDPASQAVDGNWFSSWVSGGFPPQWIEVDLGSIQTVGEIDLGITQLPDSFTIHEVFGRADTSQPWTLLHEFAGYTVDQQLLQYVLSTPEDLRYIRIETPESASWVGWREIDVWAPPPPRLYDFVAAQQRPVAGRSFTGIVVVNLDPQATSITRVLCDAQVAGQRLPGRRHRFFSTIYNKVTAVACSWHIPANAGGKTLSIWGYPFGSRVGVFGSRVGVLNDSELVTDSDSLSWRVKR